MRKFKIAANQKWLAVSLVLAVCLIVMAQAVFSQSSSRVLLPGNIFQKFGMNEALRKQTKVLIRHEDKQKMIQPSGPEISLQSSSFQKHFFPLKRSKDQIGRASCRERG